MMPTKPIGPPTDTAEPVASDALKKATRCARRVSRPRVPADSSPRLRRFRDRIASLRDRFTIVIVTHTLAQARRIADTTALFWVCNGRGCLVEYGQTAQFFDAPESDLTAAYLRGLRG
jgi:hypothetical protein